MMAPIVDNCWTDVGRKPHDERTTKTPRSAGSPAGPSSEGLGDFPRSPDHPEGAAAPRRLLQFLDSTVSDFDLGRSSLALGPASPIRVSSVGCSAWRTSQPVVLRILRRPVVSARNCTGRGCVLRSGPDVAAGGSGPVITEALRRPASCPTGTSRARALIYRSSTSSARRCRPCCSPVKPPAWPTAGTAARSAPGRAGRRAPDRARPALRPGAHRPAPRGRTEGGHRHHVAVRPREAAGRRASASTTSSPPATASGTAPTTAPSTASSSGVRASSRPSAIWAKDHGVDVDESWAYSDSVYDLPLLSAVRPPHRGEPRSAAGHRLRGAALAAAVPRRPRRRAQARRPRAAAG